MSDIVDWTTMYTPRALKRKGGSSTNWATPGSTNYDVPPGAKMQFGVTSTTSISTDIVFPEAFANAPIVLATPLGGSGVFSQFYIVSITTTGFSFVAQDYTRANAFHWIAIGI